MTNTTRVCDLTDTPDPSRAPTSRPEPRTTFTQPGTRRSTRAVKYGGGEYQVQYWKHEVQVWCDFGDTCRHDQVDAKMERCRKGLRP